MLDAISPDLDVRELIVQTQSMAPLHSSESRMRPEEIAQFYILDESLKSPEPQIIALFDDVLVAGTHFKAAQMVLRQAYPQVYIVGIFIARRVPETTDIEDFMAD